MAHVYINVPKLTDFDDVDALCAVEAWQNIWYGLYDERSNQVGIAAGRANIDGEGNYRWQLRKAEHIYRGSPCGSLA